MIFVASRATRHLSEETDDKIGYFKLESRFFTLSRHGQNWTVLYFSLDNLIWLNEMTALRNVHCRRGEIYIIFVVDCPFNILWNFIYFLSFFFICLFIYFFFTLYSAFSEIGETCGDVAVKWLFFWENILFFHLSSQSATLPVCLFVCRSTFFYFSLFSAEDFSRF